MPPETMSVPHEVMRKPPTTSMSDKRLEKLIGRVTLTTAYIYIPKRANAHEGYILCGQERERGILLRQRVTLKMSQEVMRLPQTASKSEKRPQKRLIIGRVSLTGHT
jgi:hypothetical protein